MRVLRILTHKDKIRLSKDHTLEVTVNDSSSAKGEELSLKAEIAGAESDGLTALITSKKERGVEVTRIVKLKGRWRSDDKNRLAFVVSKEDGREDVLVFDGIWEIGKDNELVYRYKKTGLKRRTKEERSLIFRGAWRITGRDRLAYLLDTSGESGFTFKAQLEDAGISGRYGVLKYKVGIGVSDYKRPVERVIKLLGTVRWDITRRDSLEFDIVGAEGRKPWMSVTLSRKLLGGEAFLRFKKLAEESKAEAGAKFRW